MNVRGWLILGSGYAAQGLPQERSRGWLAGNLPNASDFQPGDWMVWNAGAVEVTIVCVELPLDQ